MSENFCFFTIKQQNQLIGLWYMCRKIRCFTQKGKNMRKIGYICCIFAGIYKQYLVKKLYLGRFSSP